MQLIGAIFWLGKCIRTIFWHQPSLVTRFFFQSWCKKTEGNDDDDGSGVKTLKPLKKSFFLFNEKMRKRLSFHFICEFEKEGKCRRGSSKKWKNENFVSFRKRINGPIQIWKTQKMNDVTTKLGSLSICDAAKYRQQCRIDKDLLSPGSGGGSVGRGVASNTKGPRLESHHQHQSPKFYKL